MVSKTFAISGMTCGHCEGKVTAELMKLSGVAEVLPSAKDANVKIESSQELSVDEIKAAVSRAGYVLA